VHEKSLILLPGIADEIELAEKLVARLSELGRRNLKAFGNVALPNGPRLSCGALKKE